MAARKGSETVKLQSRTDTNTDRILEELVDIGIYGTSKSEVVSSILRDWIWSNEEKLARNGIILNDGAK